MKLKNVYASSVVMLFSALLNEYKIYLLITNVKSKFLVVHLNQMLSFLRILKHKYELGKSWTVILREATISM